MPEIIAIDPRDSRPWSGRVYLPTPDRDTGAVFVFAHGAGAGRTHAFMVDYAIALRERGVAVVTFNFPYMERGRRMPDRRPVLESCYVDVIGTAQQLPALAPRRLFIGGKSMGGRMATYVAAGMRPPDRTRLSGVVLLGYPLHPPGKPEQLRSGHLPAVGVPMLFVQGTRDTFGTPADLEAVLQGVADVTVRPVAGGDHSFKVPARTGSQASTHRDVQDAIVEWIRERARTATSSPG